VLNNYFFKISWEECCACYILINITAFLYLSRYTARYISMIPDIAWRHNTEFTITVFGIDKEKLYLG